MAGQIAVPIDDELGRVVLPLPHQITIGRGILADEEGRATRAERIPDRSRCFPAKLPEGVAFERSGALRARPHHSVTLVRSRWGGC